MPIPSSLRSRPAPLPSIPAAGCALLLAACSGEAPLDDAARRGAPASPAPLQRLDPAALRAPLEGDATPVEAPLALVAVRDANGEVCAHLPLPRGWRLQSTAAGRYRIDAPGGVSVNETESADYAWAEDGFARETIARTGKQLVAPLSVERIIAEGIEPMARSQGYSLASQYELPELQAFWEAFGAAMPATGSRRGYRVVGTDWNGPDGRRSCIVVLRAISAQGSMVSWSVHTTELEAPAETFERAKRTWLDALAHQQIDHRWQQAKGMRLTAAIRRNQEESRAWMEVGRDLHRRRMADIAAAGRTALAVGAANGEILDRSHAGFRDRSAADDVGHRNGVDGIGDRTVVVDADTGSRYQVDAGHRHYWGDGETGYIGTDDPNYDPRLDPALRHRPWVRLDPVRD